MSVTSTKSVTQTGIYSGQHIAEQTVSVWLGKKGQKSPARGSSTHCVMGWQAETFCSHISHFHHSSFEQINCAFASVDSHQRVSRAQHCSSAPLWGCRTPWGLPLAPSSLGWKNQVTLYTYPSRPFVILVVLLWMLVDGGKTWNFLCHNAWKYGLQAQIRDGKFLREKRNGS